MNKVDVILVLDVGKTNSKISLVNLENGNLETTYKTKSKGIITTRFKALDIDHLWSWFFSKTRRIANNYLIKEIITTTHGATAALIDDKSLVLPIIDYEFDQYQLVEKKYSEIRPSFSESASPSLSAGLNLGKQIFWIQENFKTEWKQVKAVLTFPQYLSWFLSGQAVSELTSLGCHTDLWDYKNSRYSSLVKNENWNQLFPPLLKAGDFLGQLSKDIAKISGLSNKTSVLNGIHDSNASLVPYLKYNNEPKNVISSGTWVVICSIGNDVSFDPIPDEMMISMNYKNEMVPSMRFMGGREWEILQTSDQQIQLDSIHTKNIEDIIQLECYPLPSFVNAGPFAKNEGRIINELKLSIKQRAAIASLYLALMTRYCLDKLQNDNDIIVEGGLTKNQMYLQILQALSDNQQIKLSIDQTGTTYGAACLSQAAKNWQQISLSSLRTENIHGIKEYYLDWLDQLKL